MKCVLFVFLFFISLNCVSANVSNISEDGLKMFLFWDDTDLNEYTQYYDCDHFVRDTARSALNFNITMGGVILSNDYGFKDETHAMNYIYIDNEIILIEPQTDELFSIHEITEYRYVKFFPFGAITPSACSTGWVPDHDLATGDFAVLVDYHIIILDMCHSLLGSNIVSLIGSTNHIFSFVSIKKFQA